MAKTQTRPWDSAEHVETEEDMAVYPNAALEDGDLALIMTTLREERDRVTVTIARRELRKWLRASDEGHAVEAAVGRLLAG